MKIEDWRRRIDEIDRKLVELLNERSQCAIEIGKIKRTTRMRVYDPQREREVFENVRRLNAGPLDEEGLRRLFERVIDECRRIERVASKEEIEE
jgi:chorismate mutase